MPRLFSPVRGEDERAADEQRAVELQRRLDGEVTGVAITFVDHSGAGRIKLVPLEALARAARFGVGFSPVIDAFTSDGGINPASPLDRPDGDLRMVPDLEQLVVLADPAGWAWAPGDRFYQDGTVYPNCQRSFARRQVAAAQSAGLSALMAVEVEWMVGKDTDDFVPAFGGTGYGVSRFAESAGYVRDVVDSLTAAGVTVEQIHPEYGPAQFEVSVAAADPVSAADTSTLAKLVISAVSARHGLRASFSPAVLTDNVGNGGHLHASFWRDGANLLAGGDGRYGLTSQGESILAALLDSLPALLAIGAPTPASYLRLQPSRWAGAYQIWGIENREAAMRLIAAPADHAGKANAELKCFDLSANPYLLTGAITAVAVGGAGHPANLPPEVSGDPAAPGHPQADSAVRLPASLSDSVKALEERDDLQAALGAELLASYVAACRAAITLAAGQRDEQVIAAARWLI
ncbi:MAG TPA: glutamine synthetase family protein [Streptosporangiaceae bacterium]|nr:glutamine synthetase family protein [Streptosporangiaceae bacterium]